MLSFGHAIASKFQEVFLIVLNAENQGGTRILKAPVGLFYLFALTNLFKKWKKIKILDKLRIFFVKIFNYIVEFLHVFLSYANLPASSSRS